MKQFRDAQFDQCCTLSVLQDNNQMIMIMIIIKDDEKTPAQLVMFIQVVDQTTGSVFFLMMLQT